MNFMKLMKSRRTFIKKAVVVLVFAMAMAGLSFAQDISGDWNGTLKINGAELRLVLHVSKNPDGTLKSTLDSIDQNANDIPVASTTLKDSQLSLKIEAVHGTYEGKVNADASEIDGTWTQGTALELNFRRGAIAAKPMPKKAEPTDVDGDWVGDIDTGMVKLRVVIHIVNTDQGLTATMDSLDQNAYGIPVTSVTRNASSLKLEMKAIGGAYDGTIADDKASVKGTWTQMGKSFPLALKKVKSAAEMYRPRPQMPVKPYPYHEEEVTYDNPKANIKLAGTMTIPPGKGPFPAVLLMAGSGPNDRDETLMGHKPFLVLADYLTRKGIVVLRYDKRGVGKSGGDFTNAVMWDFGSDGEAGIAYLKTRPEVNVQKIGIIGHSEGGLEAPMIAMHDPAIAFVVLMAGPGVKGDELLAAQQRLLQQSRGISAEEIEKDATVQRKIFAILEKDEGEPATGQDIRAALTGTVPDAQLGMQVKILDSPWFRGFLLYDPAPTLTKLTCPVLAINGERDLQVPPDQNLPAIRKALANNRNVEVDELPGLNHLFQDAKTGAIGEYAEIDETMSPVALEKIAGWVLKQAEAQRAKCAVKIISRGYPWRGRGKMHIPRHPDRAQHGTAVLGMTWWRAFASGMLERHG